MNKDGRDLIGVLQMKEKTAFINYVKYKLRDSSKTDCDTKSWKINVKKIDEISTVYSTSEAIISAMKNDNNKQLQSIISSPLTRNVIYDVLSLYDSSRMCAWLLPFHLGKAEMLKIVLKYVTSKDELKKLFDLKTKSYPNVYGFQLAVKSSRLAMTKELIAMSKTKKYRDYIDVDRKSTNGSMAINFAIQNSNYEMIKILYNEKYYGNNETLVNKILGKCVSIKNVDFKDRFSFFKKVLHTSARFVDANALMKQCLKSEIKERDFFEYLVKVNDLFTLKPLKAWDVWTHMGTVCDSKLMQKMFTVKFNGVDYVCCLVCLFVCLYCSQKGVVWCYACLYCCCYLVIVINVNTGINGSCTAILEQFAKLCIQ